MINSLLIANRGEIACRIIRTARQLGIRTVAVYSDADTNALHVRQADQAVHIGASPARESYLLGERIIAAAQETGAEAIHPGYGFLSENADFAEAVIAAGLIWVGPNPDSIRAMGLKDAAKKLMQDARVPVTPGYLGEDQSLERLQREAGRIGYPVLIKAVAGGGGKGMRRVDAAQQFADALAACQREAASSFGDDRVLIEKYILTPRHIEVQVFGDTHGNIVHLFERDCSMQRRHQKVIEEAPAPGMSKEARFAACEAAVKAARAVDYVGAGTIEFIADASHGLHADRIWFMEMNTRLQVEHPVTEAITGVDLVEWQLRVASGEPLPLRQEEIAINGHAVEVRLYAEDPARGFLPSTGKLEALDFAGTVRVDTGVEAGSTISPFYDPMIAKLVAHGEHRDDAIALLRADLSYLTVWPVRTNAGFLFRLLGDEGFVLGQLDTGLIERRGETLTIDPLPTAADLTYATAWFEQDLPDDTARMPRGLEGFRLNRAPATGRVVSVNGERVTFEADRGILASHFYPHARDGAALLVHGGATFRVSEARTDGAAGAAAGDGSILAPMPGRIVSVEVMEGQAVTAGQKLLVLEAMKMEQALTAPFDGTIETLNATPGAQVQVDALLVKVAKLP
ncbi:acetyl/propionyl/methylcrotonyl-CoA carboxylase subunit alpha [Sphingomonas sp. BT-65]|uniref:acetyl/propionyl/methylcrotonyl-CoA carboxylase subunit alpha n=1 Tax=Sphingomonas sp. BT-65 TaxID=2989821 RepID=UPI0022354821|nr:acetyl/propionyl/methylcrotonyl-CoA carboxylase subunit alpha [Sphingomonas sp. BT-65]MCW4460215.1 acetyl/propionyl/methylcrotonyl-CoA carboxylase subunit alpha [Sphingomonas sp. BT-65]